MRTRTLLSFASAVAIDSMSMINKALKPRDAKTNHIQDLQDRLDYVASKATYKGNRIQIGSTMPYAIKAKRAKVRAKNNLKVQFIGNANENGINELYLKDGQYVAR